MSRNFKFGMCLDMSGTDKADCSRKVASGRNVAGAMRSLANARDLQLECARVLRETLFVPILMYGSERVLWKEKERSRIRMYRWTTSEVCLVLGGCIEFQMQG